MTLQQLADLINVDRQYIWNIENGEVKPRQSGIAYSALIIVEFLSDF